MNILKKKAKTAAIALVLLMASVTIMANMPVNAQIDQPIAGPLPPGETPSITITTDPYLSFRPNPVGLDQVFLVNMWLHPPINVERQFIQAYNITIAKPDGTKDVITMDSYCGDSTAWFEYVADQVGTWKLKLEFLGMYFPNGSYSDGQIVTTGGSYIDSAYYKPSSTAELELVVQSEPVLSWPPSPLPTDYWTRPVSPENREWWPILGNYPETGVVGGGAYWPDDTNIYMSTYEFVPYVQAPNSAHIVWKREFMIGGLVGGEAGQISLTAAGLSGGGFPSIIYAGRCYDTYSKPTGASSTTYWRCYDLRTGEVYWEYPATMVTTTWWIFTFQTPLQPTFVEYAAQGAEVPGAYARAGVTPYLVAITSPSGGASGRLIKWDPYTGAVAINVTGPPPGVSAGELYGYPYVLSVQNLGGGNYRLINWTIENNAGNWVFGGGGGQPTVDDFYARVKGNITWPFSSLGTCDFEAGVAVVTQGISSPGTGTDIGVRLIGVSIKTGGVLWNVTTDLSTGLETFFSGSTATADHGKYAVRMQNGEIWAWNLSDGHIAWKNEISDWPWGVFGPYDVQSAYGLYYTMDYAGVRAIDWDTGDTVWTYKAPANAYETPYFWDDTPTHAWHSGGMVADGKLYTFNTEHTPTQPITRGWRLHCINATTGEGLWNITLGQGVPGSRQFQGAIADGYLAHTNEYDGYMYVFGKGKSATTVSAPQTTITLGGSVVLTGTVLDMSPAQPGTPCVSKESMATYMEYLHMQKPIPDGYVVTGVPVMLLAIGSDGNVIDIGTVKSDLGGFRCEWTPPDEDLYTITASFMGDDSYGSSWAATALSVGPAPPTPLCAEDVQAAVQAEIPAYTAIDLAIIAAVVVAIIIGIVNLWALRKRS
ncbi:MAG: hypothetical protein OEY40_00580 [Candidatus Bathyarchaeota archaeon]|nr:hypothetical protein [Candidatus Bathyarchaeota archaeon]